MSSQQLLKSGVPSSGLEQAQMSNGNNAVVAANQSNTVGGDESSSDAEPAPLDHPPSEDGALPFRDEKQEMVVVRPYPQAQVHGQPQLQHLPVQPGTPVTMSSSPAQLPQGLPLPFSEGPIKAALKTPVPSRLIAPAPAASQGLVTVPPQTPGHVTVTVESSTSPSSAIPVAAISSQQGHSSNLHQLMAANVQIIRGSAPALHITSPAAPPHSFTTHLPRGAAAAAVISSSKGSAVLRPIPNVGSCQPSVQHIIHQPVQSCPTITTSTTVPPAVVAPITAARAQSPVITMAATHSAEIAHGRAGLAIHPQSAAISIQRPPPSWDAAPRITLPSHPAVGAQKPQVPHGTAQKSIFSSVTPVAAATVAPILATSTAPVTTTTVSVPHTQMTTSNVVTVTVPSHSSHATAVTTSTIPVAKVVPQPIAHSSARIHTDYPGDRANLISISGHCSSPNPVAMEARSDNRQPVPMQFQYILPTYSSPPYPLPHAYTPITSSVSTIRQYPVTPQAPSSAIPIQAGVSVASAVHLNPMQLMTVDRIGLQSAQMSAQGIQPVTLGTQGIQPATVGAQGLHIPAPVSIQQQQQQPQAEAKAPCSQNVVLADGSTLIPNPISSAFSITQAITTEMQSHPQSSSSTPTLVSSPRPSILRKKPANEGTAMWRNLIPAQPNEGTSPRMDNTLRSMSGSPRPSGVKFKPDVQIAVTSTVMAAVEALPSQGSEQQATASPAQQPPQADPAVLAEVAPPSQTTAMLSSISAAVSVTQPLPTSLSDVLAQPTQPAASCTAASIIGSTLQEIKIKQEVEPMDTSKQVPSVTPSTAPMLTPLDSSLNAPSGDTIPGASPRKKPRKQQHVISTEESEMMETNCTDEEKATARTPLPRSEKHKSLPEEFVDDEGIRYVPVHPRPSITMLRHYRNPWKAAYHHYQRYSDVRVKEEKKGTLQDMANQKGVACRAQGWKIHLCAAQLLQLTNLEHDVYSRLMSLQEGLIPKKSPGADDDLHCIDELIQGNMQRCKLVMDQVTEARDIMMKVLDHRDRVIKLLDKNGGTKKGLRLKLKDRA
ncbi:histone deacetylase complex subunit SAP130a [Megalops cyprinoides]|uniref:histone deacetylase complex subunit SAP130a n=1 Tax=Megalops cyprinoides TaxID=118141 RepID=UPI001864571D|nr:histone deacetylase complex subunit SAP130a [Megalops cyprinoides]XP_036378365.1 histone deacetylase complex subunit SAP130a [Megalops cyprinoides]